MPFTANFALKVPVHVYNVGNDLIEKGNVIENTPVSDSIAYTLEFDLADDSITLQTPVARVVGGKSSSTFTSSKKKNVFSNNK